MQFDTHVFFCALGLAFVLEGLPWALFPRSMRRIMFTAAASPSVVLRRMGLLAIGIGLLTVWLARG